jgi:hypothetical protein
MDEKCMLWVKQLILWMKQLFSWMKTLLFRVMDQKVILWMKHPNLWKTKYQPNVMLFLYHLRISYCNIIQNDNTVILFKCWCWYYLFLLD